MLKKQQHINNQSITLVGLDTHTGTYSMETTVIMSSRKTTDHPAHGGGGRGDIQQKR